MNKEKEFIVYQIANLINQKLYIGITSDFKTRMKTHFNYFKNSNKYLYNAIKKYRKENFKVTIIDYAKSSKEACEKEIYWIVKLDTYKNGYNQTLGGDGTFGYIFTEKDKKKMSKSHKGKKLSKKSIKKRTESRDGYKHTRETINKISKSLIGHKVTDKTRQKMSKARKKWKYTEESKKKMSKAQKLKKLSKETKDRMSIAKQNMSQKTKNRMAIAKQKLSDDQVKEIRKLLKQKVSQRKIAKLFNVCQGTISKIKVNKTYKK